MTVSHHSEQFKTEERKRRRREFVIMVMTFITLVLFTQFQQTIYKYVEQMNIPRDFFSKIMFLVMVNVDIVLILVLLFFLFRNLIKLIYEIRKGKLGSKLRAKLVVIFLFFAIMPTTLLFYISTQFINNSIEKFFSDQVFTSLRDAKRVAQFFYDDSFSRLQVVGERFSKEMSAYNYIVDDQNKHFMQIYRRFRFEHGIDASKIFMMRDGNTKSFTLVSDRPMPVDVQTINDSEGLERALAGRVFKSVVRLSEGEILRVYIPIFMHRNPNSVVGCLVVAKYADTVLGANLERVEESFLKLKPGRGVLKSGYFVLLVVMTLLILFTAVWLGFYLAREMTGPIQELAEATKRLAEGDYDVTIEITSKDEVGTLVKAFNSMTRDLRVSRTKLRRAYDELTTKTGEIENRRRYMEAVLINVRAGVISIGKQGKIETVNKAAANILQLNRETLLGENFRDLFKQRVHQESITDFLKELSESNDEFVQKNITISIGDGEKSISLSVEVLRENNGRYMGMIVVFDDMTELVKAQRMAAWREVARRIAHEIKNPLTPVKLSAQRLRRRFSDALPTDADRKVFEECTRIIIEQVDHLKILVNEFSRFARLPQSNPKENNINLLVEEVVKMYEDNHPNIDFYIEKVNVIPMFLFDREQMWRVFINLINNAISAISGTGEIVVCAEFNEVLQIARIVVKDTGKGIPKEAMGKLFEPYFSTKKRGTGLGLAIVNQIVSDHHGYIRVDDNTPQGTKFVLEFPVTYSKIGLSTATSVVGETSGGAD